MGLKKCKRWNSAPLLKKHTTRWKHQTHNTLKKYLLTLDHTNQRDTMTAQTDKQGKKKMEPKIYVACLASYNSGILHGVYIDATLEPDEMLVLIGEMLEKSPVISAEEWEIHDFDDFDCIRIDRWEDLQQVHDIACFLVEKGELGAKLMQELSTEDVDEARRVMEDDYIGEYNSIVEYAMERTADCCDNIPDYIAGYIDYKAMAEDLSHDLIEIELYGSVHLFHNT